MDPDPVTTVPAQTPSSTEDGPLRVAVLAGGVGAARFLRGLLAHTHRSGEPLEITVIGNTADDLTLNGLRICPDLDTVMYTLGDGVHEEQGWGRTDETFAVAADLAEYGLTPDWFTLGDRDIATHLARTALLAQGLPLSRVTELLCRRWQPGVRLLPMTDDPVETHVVLSEDGRTVHFQEWWVRLHAAVPADRFVLRGIETARPAPGVLAALAGADVVLLPPSNPVVSLGTVLAVPGIRAAVRGSGAPVVGVSPLVGGAPVRGMADACLATVGVPADPLSVAGMYRDLLDGWLVDTVDAPDDVDPDLVVLARPLLMTDLDTAAEIAGAALGLALSLRGSRTH
jgi:LPPG:FO 2-phospho-L-lactate transferase